VSIILLILLVAGLVLGPQLWVRRVLARYNREEEAFPGNGGELARHLLDRFHLGEVSVESTEAGDHYDPQTAAVRLTPDKLRGRTLTAITTAAHEVGHAIQHGSDYAPLRWRSRLVRLAMGAERAGSFLLFATPVIAVLTRHPVPGAIMLAAAAASLGVGLLVQLVTLPVELDASFRKALPILRSGYLDERQQGAARKILLACALTYVASSLAGLLNFWRWMRLLRR
jgi:Zn-dependent membrane protease YugP